MERYYLQQVNGKWQLTHQVVVDELTVQAAGMAEVLPVEVVEPTPPPPVFVDDFVQGTYDTWQEALEAQVDAPIALDPQPDWPVEIGGNPALEGELLNG